MLIELGTVVKQCVYICTWIQLNPSEESPTHLNWHSHQQSQYHRQMVQNQAKICTQIHKYSVLFMFGLMDEGEIGNETQKQKERNVGIGWQQKKKVFDKNKYLPWSFKLNR